MLPAGGADSAAFVAQAEELARRFLTPLERRWKHVQAVAMRADELRRSVASLGRAAEHVLVAAAWLHDIGYAPEVGMTGFHPLDGARYLERLGYPRQIVCLVAHHSGARYEAEERGLSAELAAFELEDSPIMDALVTADMTTGPDGTRLAYRERIAEILTRYPTDSPVHAAWLRADSEIGLCVERTEARMRQS
ncbi:HD domain-containing protein [Actinokineospora fastidiosa]|uniref:Metal-dependent phosphohydrolase, HD subdomain protein n=1 Tax=Actinokineospora fastidiosa TaxID=1816 RepID=A0A918G6V5_9PSEU|nr:HD domain-containing protein [Actinokineospora fastidiosa]GGS21213.1 metal-dependent phosphohydrolase, HD subdomain protein [Actinokineospora fastidiosa]